MSRTKPASTGGTAQAGQRLQQELMQLMMDPIENVTAFPEEDNLFYWVGAIQGAPNTAYEGLEYRLSLRFPGSYPIEPPVVVFLTSCFHPNVDPSGVICLDILKENWSAAISIRELLLSILSLLDNANVDSPLNQEAARLWGTPGEYQRRVRQCYDEAVMKAQALAPSSRS